MRRINYEEKPDHAGSETHRAVDEVMQDKDADLPNLYAEGFAAASGVRGETAETGGRVKHPETADKSKPAAISTEIEEENSGLADN